ncbi:hypothetical protein QBC34DRAFT_54717 [Podospora aff. communis PSN243]|uniref:T6SS Phospholipase effector Tle1-like catalytic domain-containing protein n=1 Tax=Podospora aff. communis PSN243 TaxID=3040156 RepID=A0AAV9GRG8_9PEZI|nr:hypothetical protein QBC34DRAFT_54717 [Podospora aff. communis PSN243]
MGPQIVPCAHRSPAEQWFNRKRIIVCCDGTWNSANTRGSGDPTNVARLSGAFVKKCCSGMPQVVYYHSGVGTEISKVAHYLGGLFGIGVIQDIVESYRFICDNYNPGDEIIIIGFSRGAFTARSVAGMVCALGFLNRSGLDQLPHIFHDYETWQDWGGTEYDPENHLVGFTIENKKRLERFRAARDSLGKRMPWEGSVEKLQADLDKRKRALFNNMRGMTAAPDPHAHRQKGARAKMNLKKMAEAYSKFLVEEGMSLAKYEEVVDEHNNKIRNYVPVKGRVRAVGVWDTVGSLGIPRTPLHSGGRREQEIRFESLDVSSSVDYAFHGLALDEWRSAFDCTMWGKKDNNHTNLRQVWFPGSHCNAGGGWPDQQIATIALAWMADQLTSISVEFSKVEMNRIFYELRPGAIPKPWGMGTIYNPGGPTTYLDKLIGFFAVPYRKFKNGNTEYPPRKPGGYTADGCDDRLVNPNEFVHPCVRIRYLYGGLNMDDKGPWKCRALTERGYKLEARPISEAAIREFRTDGAISPYQTVAGTVMPFYDKLPPRNPDNKTVAVRTEQPFEPDDLKKLDDPKTHWVWVNSNIDPKKKLELLPEEQIGMWERMYIRNNEKLLSWHEREQTVLQELHGKRMKPTFIESIKAIFGLNRVPPVVPMLATAMASEHIPPHYGYHDLISWQKADTTPNKAPAVLRAPTGQQNGGGVVAAKK